jgi:hypothetical protein
MNYVTGELIFHYSYDHELFFTEKATLKLPKNTKSINKDIVDALCYYTFILAGTSYYKLYVAPEMKINQPMDYWQADFFNMIYAGGLSQFIYENNLQPSDIAHFEATSEASHIAQQYNGKGLLLMQSGGKDSLLSAELLKSAGHKFYAWHMSTTGKYPKAIDATPAKKIIVSTRKIDLVKIQAERNKGGLNGHIPFSAIFAGYGLIQAALLNLQFLIASNESSADEANVEVNGYKVNHQYSKTFAVEKAIQEYLDRYVSHEMHYGSLLRPFDELTVGRLFAKYAWPKYKHKFSSCNLANYKQGEDSGDLTWDGTCPKCANTFLLLAPFVPKKELTGVFNDKNVLTNPEMTETFRQLMGLSEIKPFECVGTFSEMKKAYQLAVKKNSDYMNEGIPVPEATDYQSEMGEYQDIFNELINYKKLI